jgi:hypothetical protein
MYISHIDLQNLRCFREASCRLRHPTPEPNSDEGSNDNVNLIVGGNGSGKTTILKAISLAVLTPILRDCGYVSHRMVREGETSASIGSNLIVNHVDKAPPSGLTWSTALMMNRFDSKGARETLKEDTDSSFLEYYHQDEHPSFFLVGYGATRRMETGEYSPGAIRRKRWLRYHRTVTLFEDNEALTPLESWLPSFRQTKRFDEIFQLINQLLPDDTQLIDDHDDGDYFFAQRGLTIPLSTLSDGYRAYIAWTTDLISHITACITEDMAIKDLRGVVLVDEVDLHLHPEWQLQIIDRLSQALPNLQFIFTSHSPIVAGTFKHPPLVIEPDSDGAMIIRQLEENIYGMSSEQILHSPYFGMRTTRAPGKERELLDLLRQAQEGDLKAAQEYLEMANSEDRR